jgi:hypothetical protein
MRWLVDHIPVLCTRCSWPKSCRDEIDVGDTDGESARIWACRYGCACHAERISRLVGVISVLVVAIDHYRDHQELRRIRRGRT